MVFCYKIITESPRRSACVSPRKRSPVRIDRLPSSISQLIGSIDYDASSNDILDSIPEREWKLLGALARKREEDDERDRLADQFRKMWQKEKEEREMVDAETSEQYNRYLDKKRQQERSWLEHKRFQRLLQQQLRRGQLLDFIRHKERRSADLLAFIDDKKTNVLMEKALEEDARILLAADRRHRLGAAEEWRKQIELFDTEKKVDNASKRRNAFLRDASQRAAISNALHTWDTALLRQDVAAMDAARRASHAAHAALTDARSARLARERETGLKRARARAAFTQRLRESIRTGRP